jgi:hypothetical protein
MKATMPGGLGRLPGGCASPYSPTAGGGAPVIEGKGKDKSKDKGKDKGKSKGKGKGKGKGEGRGKGNNKDKVNCAIQAQRRARMATCQPPPARRGSGNVVCVIADAGNFL